jgi:hypothetical protein
MGVLWGMADLHAGSGPGSPAVEISDDVATGVGGLFYGYAHQNVTRVVVRLAGGKQFSAQTFAAWPGSGLRLWAVPVPPSRVAPAPGEGVVTAYNAAGQQVWRQPLTNG